MSAWFDQPQSRFLVAAIVTLTFAAIVIKWAGNLLRGQLGAGGSRRGDGFRADVTATVPPTLVREALEKGLITAGQLAAMSEIERQFWFASLGNKLGGGARPPEALMPSPPKAQRTSVRTNAPAATSAPTPPLPIPSTLMPTDDAESTRLAAALAREGPTVHCPGCGTRLELPAFPPLVSTCWQCGTRSALRNEEGGRYILNVTPPKPV
jgi:hypothetical protein